MRPPSPAEPVSELRHVRIVESGEPLVDFLAQCPLLVFDRPRFAYRRETLLRTSAAQRLCAAAHALPPGYKLGVVEGWRAPHIQQRMYASVWNRFRERHPEWSDVQLKRVVNRYSAPMNPRVPPPHSTGGAMDVFLLDEEGVGLDLMSPYELRDPAAFAYTAPGLTPIARHHRDVLYNAMIEGGLTNYPSEYWHYSYGDQGWAYRGGHPHALYGPVTPDGWTPDPSDVTESPLVFIGQEMRK